MRPGACVVGLLLFLACEPHLAAASEVRGVGKVQAALSTGVLSTAGPRVAACEAFSWSSLVVVITAVLYILATHVKTWTRLEVVKEYQRQHPPPYGTNPPNADSKPSYVPSTPSKLLYKHKNLWRRTFVVGLGVALGLMYTCSGVRGPEMVVMVVVVHLLVYTLGQEWFG